MVTAFNLVSDHISVRLLQSPETQYTKQQAPLQKNWMWAIMLWVGIFKKAIKICISYQFLLQQQQKNQSL